MRTRCFPGATACALVVAICLSGLPAPADQLPASCGAVGAKSYTPPEVTIPPVVLNRGTVITVTNATIAVNGDTSSVSALVANPGPDGISIWEAITATNNDPGTWNIQFAPALKGSAINVNPGGGSGGLPYLTGGNVTINGDINGDGQPDITLTSSYSGNSVAISIASGGNTLYGLALQNFTYGVSIAAPGSGLPAFSNTTIANLVLTNIQYMGIGVNPPSPVSTSTQSTWDHILIAGNTITGNVAGPVLGISLDLSSTPGSTLQHTTIADNKINIPMPGGGGIAINVGGRGATNNQALDTLVANNTISATVPEFGIRIAGGGDGGSSNLIDSMQVIANQISITRTILSPADTFPTVLGIEVVTGDGASDDMEQPPVLPIQYSKNNIVRNVGILSNTIAGTANIGIFAQAACCGNSDNSIANLSILGNTLTGVYGEGVTLVGAATGYTSIPATGNALSNVLVQANSIQVTSLIYDGCNCYVGGMGISFGGIQVWGGLQEPGNSVNGISITNNDVDTPLVGISIIAGVGQPGTPTSPVWSADNNIVSGAQISCNQIDHTPTLGLDFPGIQGINVVAGLLNANGNQVEQLTVVDNLVAGVLGGASLFANLGSGYSSNPGTTTGNTISISQISGGVNAPAISGVANAESGSLVIAPNTWIAITATNLAADTRSWMLPDFVNNQLPVALDGTSVTINGQNAFVFYISPTQINVLTPPSTSANPASGPVQVQVTVAGVSSASYTVSEQPISPAFFVISGSPYVLATHADGSLIGPATLVPGSTTPAKPGETVVAYANGLGPTSVPVVAGSLNQSGVLTPSPVIQVGGITANVRFAGLISPGLYQINFDIPPGLAAGDYALLATLSGTATQTGTLITVQP